MLYLYTLLLVMAALICCAGEAASAQTAPTTRRDDVREVVHGVGIVDPYRWLEDQDSPATRAWLAEQDRYTRAVLGDPPFRARAAKRLEELIRADWMGLPTVRAGRYFYGRKRHSDEQTILYWRRGIGGKERVLVDPHPMSPDKTVSVGLMDVSRDGRRVAYSVRRGGEDEVEVRILEPDTGRELSDRIARSHVESISFTRDATGFYYTILEPMVGRRVRFHAIGTPVESDTEVFGAGYGAETMVGAFVSENGRWLTLTVYHGWSSNDLFVQDLAKGGPIVKVVEGVDATFNPDWAGNQLIVLTDYKAPKRRILAADLAGAAPDKWREIVPEGPDAIEEMSASAGRIFTMTLHNVVSRVESYDLQGKSLGGPALPTIVYCSVPSGPWDGDEVFYSYQSFAMPPVGRRLQVSSNKSSVWSRTRLPVRATDFESRQVWYTSRDGTRVPMFLVYRKGLKMDGDRPTHLTGYGGFSVSLTPGFDPEAVIWAENGGVFAMPSLRGGAEFGEAWHRAGMLANKQNVFDDFHAAAEWLIANGITKPRRLAISGGSNGGLLVGAALTQRPDLFGAVHCSVPLLDMVRYHRFLQGPQWVPEYGSADDPEQFRTLHAYSPYHHVRPGVQYPAVLFTTGDSDTRVAPLHARKMTALLQSLPDQRNPILLHYETDVGHSGGEPVAKQLERRSLIVAFLARVMQN